jgi:hypothetical protein
VSIPTPSRPVPAGPVTKDSDLTRMAQGPKPGDQKEAVPFLEFYGDECGGVPSDSPC